MPDKVLDYFDREKANPKFEREISDLLGTGILTTKIVTRLSKISMMGLVYYFEKIPDQYIFNRYDHTLAVAHLTLRLCKKLGVKDIETQMAVLAAICHDFGHGPLSHSSEGYLRLNSGGTANHQKGNHFTKIASMLDECVETLPREMIRLFPDIKSLAKAVYYITQGERTPRPNSPGASIVENIFTMFDGPLSPDVIDGDNRAFLSLSHIRGLELSPCDPETIINVISDYGEMLVVDGAHGQPLLKKFVSLQGRFYDNVIQSKKLETGEAMLVRAMELVFQSRKSRIRFSNLTDENLIDRFTRDPKSKSAQLWNDLMTKNFFTQLSNSAPDLYAWARKSFPLQNIKNKNSFKLAKKILEQKLANKLGQDPDFVIASVVQPLSWKEENVFFSPLKMIGSRTVTRWKVYFDTSQGMPKLEDRRLEIYFPAK